MLETAIVLQPALGTYVEAVLIAVLVLFNATFGLMPQSRAQAMLQTLKTRLALMAPVRREGASRTAPQPSSSRESCSSCPSGGSCPPTTA